MAQVYTLFQQIYETFFTFCFVTNALFTTDNWGGLSPCFASSFNTFRSSAQTRTFSETMLTSARMKIQTHYYVSFTQTANQ